MNEIYMFKLSKEPSQKAFKELMLESFSLADAFSLTYGEFGNVEEDELFRKLKGYLVEVLTLQHWFCYYVPEGYSKKVYLFRSCEESKNIMLELYPRLFVGQTDWPWAIEDVCFFSERKLFLGTVSHEYMCYLYPTSKEMESRFKKICKWKQEKDKPAEQIEIEK